MSQQVGGETPSLANEVSNEDPEGGKGRRREASGRDRGGSTCSPRLAANNQASVRAGKSSPRLRVESTMAAR